MIYTDFGCLFSCYFASDANIVTAVKSLLKTATTTTKTHEKKELNSLR